MIRFVLGFSDAIPIGVLATALILSLWLCVPALLCLKRTPRDLRRQVRIQKGRCV